MPRKPKSKGGRTLKPLSSEERKILKAVQEDLVADIEAAIKASPLNQTQTLEKAQLSPEMLRKWKNGKSSPTLRSLVVLLKVLDTRPAVQLVASGQVVSTVHTGAEEDGAMADDDLSEKLKTLSERDQGRVEGYIRGLADKDPLRPPPLTGGETGRTPGQPTK